MNTRSVEYRKWQAACDAERDAWRIVCTSLPGTPSYDVQAWAHWQECLRKASIALEACLHEQPGRSPKRTRARHRAAP